MKDERCWGVGVEDRTVAVRLMSRLTSRISHLPNTARAEFRKSGTGGQGDDAPKKRLKVKAVNAEFVLIHAP